MQSGLHGTLEELGLDEILQIVGVSRRTGTLHLKSRGREAMLHFRDGLLVRAASTGFQQSLGELLVRKGVVPPEVVQQALAIQQQERFRERIGTILCQRFQVDLQIIEKTVREQISNVLMTLFAWTDGGFDFSPQDIETVDAAYLDPVQLILELGDSAPEQLLVEGVRMQESLGADAGQPDELEEPAALATEAVVPARPTLVVVDDDKTLATAVTTALQDDFTASAYASSEEALVQIDNLYRTGVRPTILVDLIMPKMDGSGVLGGLELVHLLRRNFTSLTIIVVSDFQHPDAIKEVEGLGCCYLDKPRRGEVNGEPFSLFVKNLKSSLQAQA